MMGTVAEIDATLAQVLAAHRPIGAEEPLADHAGPFAATPEALSGWVQHAGARRVCIYARGQWAPVAVGTQARALSARGLIDLRQWRSPVDPTLFDYAARRTEQPFRRVQPLLRPLPLSAEARALFAALERAAKDGRACPSLNDLAARTGVRSANAVSAILARLVTAQLIKVEYDAATGWRGVEILATGAKTAGRSA